MTIYYNATAQGYELDKLLGSGGEADV